LAYFPSDKNDYKKQTDINFRYILYITKKWNRIIIAVTVLLPLLAAIYSFLIATPIYQAKTLMMVTVASDKLQTTNPINRIDPNTGQVAAMPVLTMNTYLGQLKSEFIMDQIISTLNLATSSGSLAKKIEATIVTDSNLIEVKVYDPDPTTAAAIANTLTDVYLNQMEKFMFSSVVVLSPANIPHSPVKPNKMLNIEVAFLIGIFLSVILAVVLEYIDNTLKTADDVERVLNLPVLGIIPAKSARYTDKSASGGNDV